MVVKDTLKQWFSNGKKPDEQQFWAWLESYWHKDEKIPIETIQDIQTILSGKADTELVNNLIKQLEGKADKSVVEALQKYIDGLIDDSLAEADNKTYSINKINEITKGLITEAVTDVDYNAETGVLTIKYDVENSKEINLPKDNFLSEVKYNPETKDITFTMVKGSAFTVNVAELVGTYEASPGGGLEIINTNQFQIKEKGVAETMLSEELQKKLSRTGGTLQGITENGNTTDKEIIIQGATLGADKNGNLKLGKGALSQEHNIGSNLTAIGVNALAHYDGSSGDYKECIVAVGNTAAAALKGGGYSVLIGNETATSLTNSVGDTIIGAQAALDTVNSNGFNTLLGIGTAAHAKTLKNEVIIGANCFGSYSGNKYKTTNDPERKTELESGGNVVIGKYAGFYTIYGRENVFIGYECGYRFRNYGEYNTFLGPGITYGYGQVYSNTAVVIGSYAPIPEWSNLSNKLVIHAKRREEPDVYPLIYGDFKERWLKLSGKLILPSEYTPDADATPAEGQQPFSPTKMLVADVDGNVGVQKILSPETPVTNTYSFTKNYYTAVFLHPFTDTSDTTYIQIQNASPGTIRNLTIKGRLVTPEAFLKFELTAGLTPTGFNFCTYKTLRNEDLFTSIGLVYYDKGSVMLCITGDVWHKDILLDTNIIIDQIQAFESSTLNWKDDALVEVKESTIDKTLIKASITAESVIGGNPY